MITASAQQGELWNVCKEITGRCRDELVSRSRASDLVKDRFTAYKIFRDAGFSYPQIGDAFGRDHSTVFSALNDNPVTPLLERTLDLCEVKTGVSMKILTGRTAGYGLEEKRRECYFLFFKAGYTHSEIGKIFSDRSRATICRALLTYESRYPGCMPKAEIVSGDDYDWINTIRGAVVRADDCKRLFAAILFRQVLDYLSKNNKKTGVKREEYTDAVAWVGTFPSRNFETVCDFAGFDYVAMHERILKLHAGRDEDRMYAFFRLRSGEAEKPKGVEG